MTFARTTMSLVTKIGLAISAIAGLIVGLVVYLDEAGIAAKAQQMLKAGTVVSAVPTSASSSTTKRRRGGTSTTYTIRYAFPDAQGRRIEGSDTATAGEYASLGDSSRPGTIRPSARLDVVYERGNPSNNGLKSRFDSQSQVDFTNVAIAFGLVLAVALLITWGVRGFMKRRLVPEPVAVPTSSPSWQPPPVT
ncbi:MAG TPA: DUF3592 domain-containing protein [Vineibacter sp.]|nr:DUF3592 domain-containing protein [Vineibacter sp.]